MGTITARLKEVKGEGRANLVEGAEPKGLGCQLDCETNLQTSSGFETSPAKWNKPGQEMVILKPQFGKTASIRGLMVVKDSSYVARNDNLTTEPAEMFKQWMGKARLPPAHGKNTPTQTAPPTTVMAQLHWVRDACPNATASVKR